MEERSFFFFRGAKIINELRFNVANAAGRKYTDFMPPYKKFSSFRAKLFLSSQCFFLKICFVM